MKKIIFFITIFLVIVNTAIAQNNTTNPVPTNLNPEPPLIGGFELENQFGGYKAPGDLEPLPTYKSPDNVYTDPVPLVSSPVSSNDNSLESLYTSLRTPTETKQGGSIMKPLAEIENQTKKTSNNKLQGSNNVVVFIVSIMILLLIIILVTNKKNDTKDEKLRKTAENHVKLDTNDLLNNLEKLEVLKTQGTISSEEFDIVKNKIMKNFNQI